jgi:soluble lytic murein transglycosylase
LPSAPTVLDAALAADPMLVRGTELLALGWWIDASAEFDALFELKRDDPLAIYQLATYYKGLGIYRTSLIAATRAIVLSKQQASSVPVYIARLAYPIAYADLLIPEAQQYNVDPLFFSALIRLESNFNPNARSVSDARGLTQVVPTTAGDIVERLNWPPNYTDDDLYRPFVSVRFGAYYVDFVRRYLGGNLAATLAGYNAGPGASSRWLQKAGDDIDLFYETIESQQAQDYVRYTYEYFSVYRELYSRK